MRNEVKELLDLLYERKMSLDEVAERFRARSWPGHPQNSAGTFAEVASADSADPDPYIPESYDDVLAAYDRGRLTDSQYEVLANVIAEASQLSD